MSVGGTSPLFIRTMVSVHNEFDEFLRFESRSFISSVSGRTESSDLK